MASTKALMQLAHHTGALFAAISNKNRVSVPVAKQITIYHRVFL